MNDQGGRFAAFVLRVVLGLCFTLHGLQKVFGLFDGPGLTGFADHYALIGIGPVWFAYLVAFGELLAGIALILGMFHRAAALVIIALMAGAIIAVSGKNGYFEHKDGFEYDLALIALAVGVFTFGPGSWAYEINKKRRS